MASPPVEIPSAKEALGGRRARVRTSSRSYEPETLEAREPVRPAGTLPIERRLLDNRRYFR